MDNVPHEAFWTVDEVEKAAIDSRITNVSEIVRAANQMIEEYASSISDHNGKSGKIIAFSNRLINDFCHYKCVGDVQAEFEEAEGYRPWYAVLRDLHDDNIDNGSYSLEDAMCMVKGLRDDGFKDAYYAEIDESGGSPIRVDEVHDFWWWDADD